MTKGIKSMERTRLTLTRHDGEAVEITHPALPVPILIELVKGKQGRAEIRFHGDRDTRFKREELESLDAGTKR